MSLSAAAAAPYRKGLRKPRVGLPAARRRSFSKPMTPAAVGEAHEVPATPGLGSKLETTTKLTACGDPRNHALKKSIDSSSEVIKHHAIKQVINHSGSQAIKWRRTS
eukprot:3811807-Prymnesium_polylepis.1